MIVAGQFPPNRPRRYAPAWNGPTSFFMVRPTADIGALSNMGRSGQLSPNRPRLYVPA